MADTTFVEELALNAGINYLNLKPSTCLKIKAAVARQDRNASLFWTGPSTVAGQSVIGASNPGFTQSNKQFTGSAPARTARKLSAMGIPAGWQARAGGHFGWGAGITPANYMSGDDGVVFAGAASSASGQDTLGGQAFTLPGATTDTITYTFTDVDTADIYVADGTAGRKWSWSVDGGAETVITNAGSGSIVKTTVSLGGKGNHTLRLSGNSGVVIVLIVNPYDSSRRQLDIVNMGISGATSTQFILNNNPVTGRLAAIAAYKPDIVIMDDWSINDWRAAVGGGAEISVALSMQNQQTFIDACKAAGSQLIGITPLWDKVQTNNGYRQQEYADATKALYLANGMPVLDVRAALQSYDTAAGVGFYSDTVHPAQLGYDLKGSMVSQFIRQILS